VLVFKFQMYWFLKLYKYCNVLFVLIHCVYVFNFICLFNIIDDLFLVLVVFYIVLFLNSNFVNIETRSRGKETRSRGKEMDSRGKETRSRSKEMDSRGKVRLNKSIKREAICRCLPFCYFISKWFILIHQPLRLRFRLLLQKLLLLCWLTGFFENLKH